MVKYFLLASTIISGAVALSLPASAAMTGVAATKADPAVAVVDTTSGSPALLVQVADDNDQGDDNDDQGEDGQ